MAGVANSWIEQYTTTPTPCVAGSTGAGSETTNTAPTLSSCLLWLVVGLVIGGLTFQKKGSTHA